MECVPPDLLPLACDLALQVGLLRTVHPRLVGVVVQGPTHRRPLHLALQRAPRGLKLLG